MRLLPVLVCVALVSIAHAKLYHKYPKPKLNYIQLYNSHNYKYKPLLPEERRRLALFPKNPMRYMVSLEPEDNDPKPYLEKKRPLMKKFEEMIADNEIKRTKNKDILEEVDVVQKPIVEVDVIKEVSIEIVQDKPDESESQHTASEPSVVIESEAPKDNNDKEIIVQLEEIISPPKTELATVIENDNGGELLNTEEGDKYSNKNEVVGVTEKDNVSNEDSEFQKHVNVTQGKLSDTIESIDNSDKEIIIQVEDIILPPETELESNIETKKDEDLLNGEETNKYSSENELVDVTEKDSASNEDGEFQKHVNEMQDELSDMIESVVSLDNSDKEIIIQVEDIILPPKTELEASVETKDDEEKENVSQEPGELSEITKSEDALDKEIIIQLEDIILPPNIEVEAILENKSGEMLSDAEDTNGVDDATEKSNKESEFQKLVNEEQDGPSDIIESGIPIDNSDKEISIQVEDIILPPKTEFEANIESQNEVLLNGKETDKYSSENELVDVTEKDSVSNEDGEFQKHVNEMQDELSDIIESVVSLDNSDNEIIIQVEDIILPPKTKLEAIVETKNDEVLLNREEINKYSSENKVGDVTEKDNVNQEQGVLSDITKSEHPLDKEIIVQLEDIILPPNIKLETIIENKSGEMLSDAEDTNRADDATEKSNKESEFQKLVDVKQDELNDIIESVVSSDNIDKEIMIHLEDIILLPKTELEASVETKLEVLPNIEETNKYSSENKVGNVTEEDNVSQEQGELSDIIKSEDPIDKEMIVQLEDVILPIELEAMVENKSDEVLLDAEDNKESEFEKHVNEMQDELSDIIESVVSLDNSDKEIIIQLEDIILPPKIELEANIETKNDEVLPNGEVTNKDSGENKEDDVTEKDNISYVESAFQNDTREEQGELWDEIEPEAPLDKSDKELIAHLEDIVLLPKIEFQASVENKTGEVLPDVETKENESHDDPREKQDELNNIIESEVSIDNNDNEKAVQLADIILPPNNKLEAMMAENKNDEVLPDAKETIENESNDDPREKQDELNNLIESEVPIDNNDNEKAVQLADIILPPNNKLEAMMAENKNDEVLQDAKETIESEFQNDAREKENELSNIIEPEAPLDKSNYENTVQLADIILPLKIELDGSAENINSEVLPDVEETKVNVRNEENEFNQNELSNIVESEASLDNSNYKKVVQLADIILPPKTEIEVSEEDKRGEVLPDVEEINKSLNVNDVGNVTEKANVGNEESEFQNGELNDIIESETPRDNNNKEIIVQLADIISPPKSDIDSSADNKNSKVLPAVEEAHKSLNENEVDEENKREGVLPNVEETKESEFQNDARGSLDELNNIVESEAPINNNNDENIVQLADIVLPPKTELNRNAENKNDEILRDLEERNENLSKNQVDDETEKDTVNKESESQNESRKKLDELNNIINSEVPLDYSNNENTIQLADIVLPLKIELERGVESTSSEVLPVNENLEETNKSLNENEVSDVTEKANVSNEENEFQNDASKEQSELSDVIKSEAPRDNNDKEMTVQLADIILPPKSEFDSSAENKNAKVLLNVEEPTERLNESEVDDKNKRGEVLPDAEERKESEFQNDARENVLSNMIESEAPLDNSNYENTTQLADIVLPLKIELEGGVESTSSEVLPADAEEKNKYSSESEVNEGDLTEKDNVRNEESEFQNDARGSQDELNDIIESKAPLNNSNYENTVQLADIVLPPKTELEVSEENINVEVLPNDETNKSEVDVAAEKENVSKEESAQKIDDSDRENTVQLTDIILPPRTELEGAVESTSGEVLPVNEDVKETNKSLNVNEVGDVTEKVNVNNEESEFQNDAGKQQSELSDIIESESPRDNNDKEMTVQLADIILPPKTELEGNLESTSGEVFPHVEETYKNEVDDAVEKDNVSNEETIQKVDDSEKENTIQLVDIILPPKTELENGVENTSGEVLPNVEETNKSEVNDAAEKDNVNNEESTQKIDNSDKENTVQLADLIFPPKSELKVSEENKSGEVLPDVEETNKSEVDDTAEKDKVNNEETVQKIDNSDNENIVQLADIVLPPKTEFDASVEKEIGEALPDVEETNKSSSENEGDGVTDKAIEKDDVSNEESIKKIDDSDRENTVQLADIILPPKTELESSEVNKSGEVLPDVEETNKSEVNDAAEEDNVSNEETIQKVDDSEKENTIQLVDIILPPKTEFENGVENTSGEVLPNVEETNKSEVNDAAEKDNVSNEESIQKVENSDKENTVQLADIILPPKTEFDASVEKENGEALPNIEETNKSSSEDVGDGVNDKAIEKENVSNEEPEDIVTTETLMEPVIYRKKRGINIIEEENISPTVAGFKYNVKDKRLNNHLAYNNINS